MGGKFSLSQNSMHTTPLSITDTDILLQVDGVTEYIDWAVSRRFGVIDINVPAYITQDEVSTPVTHTSFLMENKTMAQNDG